MKLPNIDKGYCKIEKGKFLNIDFPKAPKIESTFGFWLAELRSASP